MRRNPPTSPDESASPERAEDARDRAGRPPARGRMEELDAILARLAPAEGRPRDPREGSRASPLSTCVAQALTTLGTLQELLTEWIPDRATPEAVDPGGVRETVAPSGDLMRELATDLARKARWSEDVEALGQRVADLQRDKGGRCDLAVLKSSLDDLCSILSRNAAQSPGEAAILLRELNERVAGLAARMDARPADPDSVLAGLAQLNGRMDALEASVTRLPEELRKVGRMADTSTVELMLRTIGEKLERRRHPDIEVIEGHIDRLAERCATAWQEPVRALAAEATGRLESLRNQTQGNLASGGDLDAVKESLVEIKDLHLRSDRKIQGTLRGIHDALESVITRSAARPDTRPADPSGSDALPVDRLQAAVRRLHAVTIAGVEAVASADRPDRPAKEAASQETPRPPRDAVAPQPVSQGRLGTSFSPPSDEAGSLRASFIAAARRATQSVVAAEDAADRPAMPDQVDGSQPTEDPERDSERLIDRLKRTLDTYKRPLAYAWAALLIGCGGIPPTPVGAHARSLVETPSGGSPTDPGARTANSQLPFTPEAL